mgnify:CR=1 FL=1
MQVLRLVHLALDEAGNDLQDDAANAGRRNVADADAAISILGQGADDRRQQRAAAEKAQAATDEPVETLLQANRASKAILDLPRPVVAVVQGPTAGVGVSLALACDLVIASEKAFFLLAFTKIGLMPDGGASALVAASIGRARAMKMALLAERLPATEAHASGLISSVHPAEDLEAEAARVIARLLAGPAVAYAKTKQAINGATLPDFDAALARETAGQHILLNSADLREGIRAFQQKREPTFTDS